MYSVFVLFGEHVTKGYIDYIFLSGKDEKRSMWGMAKNHATTLSNRFRKNEKNDGTRILWFLSGKRMSIVVNKPIIIKMRFGSSCS